MNLDQLNKDILLALTDNSGDLSEWIGRLGQNDPYKAIMVFDKLTGTYARLAEMDLTGKSEDGFNVTVEVDSKLGKDILMKLLSNEPKENEDNDDEII